MDIQEIHKLLVEEFGAGVVGESPFEATDPWIQVAADSIVRVCEFVHDHEGMLFDHLNDLCGVDYLEPDPKKAAKFGHDPHLEVVYNLSSVSLKHRLKLKVVLPRWKDDVEGELPSVPSVSSVWKIADWHEREAYDLMGIHFTDHPNFRRILCPEDWVGHALRKDYEQPLEYHGVRGK